MTILLLEGQAPALIAPVVSTRAPLLEPIPPSLQTNINATPISVALTAELAAVNAQLLLIPSLQNATATQIVPLYKTVVAMLNTLNAAITQYDADIITTNVAGLAPNVAAPQLWPILLNQENDSLQIATLLNMLGYVARIKTNLQSTLSSSAAKALTT